MMKFGFNFGNSNGMDEDVGGNEMSYDFIYSAIMDDPQVRKKLDDVRLMMYELEREIEELKSLIETLKALRAAAAAAA